MSSKPCKWTFVWLLAITQACISVPLRNRPPVFEPSPSPVIPIFPPSVFAATVEGSLHFVETLADATIPPEYDSSQRCENVDTWTSVCARVQLQPEKLRLDFGQGRISAAAMFGYHVNGNVSRLFPWPPLYAWGECGEDGKFDTRERMEVSFSTAVSWDPKWRLIGGNSRSSAVPQTRCDVTIGNIDIAPEMAKLLQNKMTEVADARLATLANDELKFQPKIQEVWEKLHEPLVIDPSLWIELRPDSAIAGPFEGTGDRVATSVALVAQPRVVAGQAPTPLPGPHPLPDLVLGQRQDSTHATMEVAFPFSELNAKVSAALVGLERKKKIPILPDPHVKIVKTTVFPAGDNIVLGLTIEGSVSGTIYLMSQLEYDCFTERASISWVDYDIDTRAMLLRLARWLAPRFLDEEMRKILAGLYFDVGAQFRDLEARMKVGLNRPLSSNIRITGALKPIQVVARYNTETAVVVVVQLGGNVSFILTPNVQVMPSPDEVKAVSVLLTTLDDNKDDDEPVAISFSRDGATVPGTGRELWRDREVEEGQAGGPYTFRYRNGAKRGDCDRDQFHLYKEPHGSEHGSGWHVALSVLAYYSDGSSREVLRRDRLELGQGEPFNLHFPFCF
jgi:hypothetical protein